ncbi:MAG TPA: nuclear transport factor 2 family protein [Devosia sp.]
MRIDLPAPLPQYFAAGDRTAAADLFTLDAVVLDEGEVHRGSLEIAAWLDRVEQSYHPRYELIDASSEGVRTVVTFKVSGTFAGSPLTLRQALVTAAGKIESLETL